MPSVEMLRMTSSGTEASMSAIRLARAATGREKVLKFAGAYHGHVDGLLAEAGSGLATQALPASPGVPAAAAASTVVVPLERPGRRRGGAPPSTPSPRSWPSPIRRTWGSSRPSPGFLELLRERADATGALLVFDEVITGFRVSRGGAQELHRRHARPHRAGQGHRRRPARRRLRRAARTSWSGSRPRATSTRRAR